MNEAQANALVRDLFHRKGFRYSAASPADCNFFGIRRPRAATDTGEVVFDDLLGVAKLDGFVRVWRGTMDPGTANVVRPVNPRGAGMIAASWQDRACWDLGVYNGRAALKQFPGARILGVRDNDLGPRHRGYDLPWPIDPKLLVDLYGTHWHYMGVGPDGRRVGPWSAACQGCEDDRDHAEAMRIAQEQKTAHPGWKFSYTRFDAREFPDALELAQRVMR